MNYLYNGVFVFIIYWDFKFINILILEVIENYNFVDMVFKIIDFGFVCEWYKIIKMSVVGIYVWMVLEVICFFFFFKSSDVWRMLGFRFLWVVRFW